MKSERRPQKKIGASQDKGEKKKTTAKKRTEQVK